MGSIHFWELETLIALELATAGGAIWLDRPLPRCARLTLPAYHSPLLAVSWASRARGQDCALVGGLRPAAFLIETASVGDGAVVYSRPAMIA